MKVLIIEDEAPAARRLSKLIQECDPAIEVLAILESIEGAVRWLESNNSPEIIFMDIHLADGLSFEIFNKTKITTPIVFTTAYDEYSIKAFSVNSIDYLLKPIEKQALQKSIDKFKTLKKEYGSLSSASQINSLMEVLNQKQSYKNRFLVKIGDRLLSVTTDHIAYFTTEEKLTLLITTDKKKYPVDFSLDDLENMLDPTEYFRLNRQYLASIKAIDKTNLYFNGKLKLSLSPDTDKEVVISREKASAFKDWLDGNNTYSPTK